METKKKLLEILTYVNSTLILVLSGLMIFIILQPSPQEVAPVQQKRFEQGQRVDVNFENLIADSYWRGTEDAATTITVFNSFTCGFCARAI
ncbi:MAG: hypothetical protein ABUK01_11160, partial [Leptospirales bacterium]